MSEHTPGPWTYSGDEDGDFCIWGPGRNEFLANVDQESFGPVPPMKIAFDINQANARLISAAPELLDALEYLAFSFKAVCEGYDQRPSYFQALEVIQKARGEAPET